MNPRSFALALGFWMIASAPARGQTPAQREAVTLQPGDEIKVTVWRNEEMSGEFPIAADGTLLHPIYRSVKVTGIPFADVETRLRTVLEQFESQPRFVAEPLLRITVGGEVDRPSLYFLRPDVTIAQVVALAGGATERGRRDRVRLTANGRLRVIKLDGTDPAANLPIRSGDQFIVEKSGSLFRDFVGPLIAIAGSAAAIINVSRPRR